MLSHTGQPQQPLFLQRFSPVSITPGQRIRKNNNKLIQQIQEGKARPNETAK